ncbi:MAG: pyrroline-5-carboxylate reductase [Candidatus Omnitrophota bacterium]
MRLGIIGCGNMGSALVSGILSKRVLSFSNIYVSDKDSPKTRALYKKFGIRMGTNEDVVKRCNIIVIAVKPQDSRGLLVSISNYLDNSKHLISIMAGVTIARIESLIKKKIAVTRAMPNMAALAGKGITVLSHNRMVKNEAIVHRIFSSVGEVVEINEKKMDAVTAVSGSGHAYFYYLTEALRDAAIKLGIKKELAERLATATLTGSGALLESLGDSPEALRKRITSKKGTTEAALNVFKAKEFEKIIIETVQAAAKRSRELSRGV